MIFLVNPLHYALQHDRRWQTAQRFPFMRARPFISVSRSEVRRLAGIAPLALVRVGAAIDTVLLVDAAWSDDSPFSDTMEWRYGQPPLMLRYHPFQLVGRLHQGQDNPILGVCEDHDCVGSGYPYEFFDELANPTARVSGILARLAQVAIERDEINHAAKALVELGVTRPMPIADSAGRPIFETVNMDQFSEVPLQRIEGICDRPQDVFMLAHALDHSIHRHLRQETVPEPNLHVAAEREQLRAAAAGVDASFLVEDDLVLSFD